MTPVRSIQTLKTISDKPAEVGDDGGIMPWENQRRHSMTLAGTVRNGVIVLDPPGQLPEGTRVQVVVQGPAAPATDAEPTLAGLLKLVGCLDDLPADFAAEHDHYIHGTPRRQRNDN
jgi:hypothetical protein